MYLLTKVIKLRGGIAPSTFVLHVGMAFAQPLPQLPLPPIDMAAAPPFAASLITAPGFRIQLPSNASLTDGSAPKGFASNYPGAWFVNFPGIDRQTIANLMAEPEKKVRNWYWRSPGQASNVDFDFLRAPVIAIDRGKPSLVVAAGNSKASDDNAGTLTAPLRTMRSAIGRAQAGDVIHVLPGVYREQLTITRSGTANKPIRILGVPDENGQLPVISGNWPASALSWNKVDGHDNIYKANIGGFLFGTAFLGNRPLLEKDDINLIEPGGVTYSWGISAMAERAPTQSLNATLNASGKSLDADSNGWFDLAAAAGLDANSSALVARAYVYAPAQIEGNLRIDGDFRSARPRGKRPAELGNRYRFWLNGESVASLVQSDSTNNAFRHPHMSVGASAGEQVVGAVLKTGWNELLFHLDASSQPRKTRFTIALPSQLKQTTIATNLPIGSQPLTLSAVPNLSKLLITSLVPQESERAVYVRLDASVTPSKSNLELPVVLGTLVAVKANFIELSGFEFRGGAQASQQAMVELEGQGNIVRGNRFIRPDVRAIGARAWGGRNAEPNVVSQNWILEPGHIGIGASGEPGGNKFNLTAENLLSTLPGRGRYIIEDNIIINSNRNGYPVLWESGCIKVVTSSGAVIRGNACIGNNGVGIWLDWENFNNRVEGNLILNAYACAICVEASPGPNLVTNNLIVATRPGPDWFRAGVLAWDGTRTWAQHNTIDGAGYGSERSGIKGYVGINLQGNNSSRGTRWEEASRDAIRQFLGANQTFGSTTGVSINPLIAGVGNIHDATTIFHSSDDIRAIPGLYRDRPNISPAVQLPVVDKHDFSGLLRELAEPSVGAFRGRTPAVSVNDSILEVEFEDGTVKRRLFQQSP